jgi:hypothetical protein
VKRSPTREMLDVAAKYGVVDGEMRHSIEIDQRHCVSYGRLCLSSAFNASFRLPCEEDSCAIIDVLADELESEYGNRWADLWRDVAATKRDLHPRVSLGWCVKNATVIAKNLLVHWEIKHGLAVDHGWDLTEVFQAMDAVRQGSLFVR